MPSWLPRRALRIDTAGVHSSERSREHQQLVAAQCRVLLETSVLSGAQGHSFACQHQELVTDTIMPG